MITTQIGLYIVTFGERAVFLVRICLYSNVWRLHAKNIFLRTDLETLLYKRIRTQKNKMSDESDKILCLVLAKSGAAQPDTVRAFQNPEPAHHGQHR